MNFFNIGFVLCAAGFNISWELNYITRLAGAGFMLAGIKELDTYLAEPRFGKYRPFQLFTLAAAAAGLVQVLLLRFGIISPEIGNILSIVFGGACGAAVLAGQYLIIKSITPDHDLVNDPSLLRKLRTAWNRYAFCAALSLVSEIIGRLVPAGGNAVVYAGIVLAASRLLMYIFLIGMGTAFNRCRMDFNAIHPA